jgi:hypothetical protein
MDEIKTPIPEEVRVILNKVARIEYRMLKDSGWCVQCNREKTVNGKIRCGTCQDKRMDSRRKNRRRYKDILKKGEVQEVGKLIS